MLSEKIMLKNKIEKKYQITSREAKMQIYIFKLKYS